MRHEIARKYLNPSNYLHFLMRRVWALFPNLIVDRHIYALKWNGLTSHLENCETAVFHISAQELSDWVRTFFPDYMKKFGDFRHKKLIEFYATFHLLNPKEEHVFMDAAGGANGYLRRLRCKKRILQNLRIGGKTKDILGPGVDYIEGNAASIPLPDESVNLISCHHSFEHFQKEADIAFVKEVQRLLKVTGRCCIVPLFIANRYAEITSRLSFQFKFDKRSLRIIDPTARIPGRYYARVYDLSAFQQRVLKHIDQSRFKVEIFELRLDGALLPDLSLKCHRLVTAVNFPYRALVLHRLKK